MATITKYKEEIAGLYRKLESDRLSHEERQLALDQIEELKKKIEEASRSEQLIIPSNSPRLRDRKPTSQSSYVSENRVML